MKRVLRHILYWYLAAAARLVLWREGTEVIAVAGTVNKSFAKEAIGSILAQNGLKAEMAYNGFNTEIGLPLAVLGLPSGYESYSRWLAILPLAFRALFTRRLAPVLILELGVSRPGDLKKLLRIVRPRAAVITDLTQRYRENFSDISAMAREYRRLLEYLPPDGLAVLNYDTITVRELGRISPAPVFYFSLENRPAAPDLWSAALQSRDASGQRVFVSSPEGSGARVIGRFGRHHIASLLIADIIGRHFKN